MILFTKQHLEVARMSKHNKHICCVMMVKIIHEVLKTSNNPLHIITWSVLQHVISCKYTLEAFLKKQSVWNVSSRHSKQSSKNSADKSSTGPDTGILFRKCRSYLNHSLLFWSLVRLWVVKKTEQWPAPLCLVTTLLAIQRE